MLKYGVTKLTFVLSSLLAAVLCPGQKESLVAYHNCFHHNKEHAYDAKRGWGLTSLPKGAIVRCR